MFNWFYGWIFAILPLAYLFRRMMIVKRKVMQDKNRAGAVVLENVEVQKGTTSLTKREELELMKCTVDLIMYRLSLIESSIYRDVNPRAYLTREEILSLANLQAIAPNLFRD
ncbi:hypothetical protein KR222_008938 [Zaprionus bogoriensis]|nr:hypothetical protein KR222_008938 [Zaprionus bogoriensis]